MSYAQLDFLADAVNPLLALALIGAALWLERAKAWRFLLRAIAATVLVQQSAKLFQKIGWLGAHFPSTHFAVALCLATFLALLHRRLIPVALTVAFGYGALMLQQRYHTPLEMMGAFYAISVAWAIGTFKARGANAERRAF